MFGISSFAQVPFASLAGTAFTVPLTEDVVMADTNTQAGSFQQSLSRNVNHVDIIAITIVKLLPPDEVAE